MPPKIKDIDEAKDISEAKKARSLTSIQGAEKLAEGLYQSLILNELIKNGDIEVIADVILDRLSGYKKELLCAES
jgi:hypothetical protein